MPAKVELKPIVTQDGPSRAARIEAIRRLIAELAQLDKKEQAA